MKSMKSEDLPKDLQGLHLKCKDFMMRWMKRERIKELDLKQIQTDLYSDLCSESPAFRNTLHISQNSVRQWDRQTEIV